MRKHPALKHRPILAPEQNFSFRTGTGKGKKTHLAEMLNGQSNDQQIMAVQKAPEYGIRI